MDGPTPETPSQSEHEPVAASGQPRQQPAAPVPPASQPIPKPVKPVGSSGPERRQDTHERARRIARALISDIVAYNPERKRRAVEAGTLKTEFRAEVIKSWHEYVQQVGPELAQGTPFFRDALNQILAGGETLF